MQAAKDFRRKAMSAADAEALAAYGARSKWPPNFPIYQRGTPADGLSLVLTGHVILRSRARSGRGFIPDIATPGETFGVEGLTPDSVYLTDAVAGDDTETLFVSGDSFRAFVREDPAHAVSVIGQLMSERTMLLARLERMASQNVESRLVAALGRLATDRSFNRGQNGNLIIEPRHHRMLCEMVGATRESIALALSRLASDGRARRKGSIFVVASSAVGAHISGLDGAGKPHVRVQESMTV